MQNTSKICLHVKQISLKANCRLAELEDCKKDPYRIGYKGMRSY